MSTLLQRALAVPSNQQRKNEISDEEIELALAWAHDEVSLKQVAMAVKGRKANGIANSWLATRLREAIRRKFVS